MIVKKQFSHERLAIVDPTSGNQPIISTSENLILAANGEIYNHLDLEKAVVIILKQILTRGNFYHYMKKKEKIL